MNKTQQQNIDNLTSLWETVSQPFQAYFDKEHMAYSIIPDAEWPNRIWSKVELTEYILTQMLDILKVETDLSAISLFMDREDEAYWDASLLHVGYEFKSIQYGMSLSLTQQYEPTNRLDFKLVKNRDEISTWCTAFEQSFGYKINETTLLHSVDKIAYYTVFLEGQPAGTVILYNTGTVAGIHSLGVVPKMRGKGIAQEIMQFVLKEALSTGAKIATLQASEMARNMYIRLGFTEDFYMKNYKHKTQNNGTT